MLGNLPFWIIPLHAKIALCCPGVTPDILFYITSLDIGLFEFYIREICHGLPLCESLHFVLYSWCSYFALFMSYLNIIKLLKLKMTAKQPFWNCLFPKVNQVIGWYSWHICQIKRRLAGNFSWNALIISLLVAVVIQRLMIRGSKCKKTIPQWYVMAMWSMRKQKLID